MKDLKLCGFVQCENKAEHFYWVKELGLTRVCEMHFEILKDLEEQGQ